MRRRRVPQRTCIGCRQVRPKREMMRIVRTPTEGVQVDERGKKSGRGAYICPNRECWENALAKNRLEHALKTTLTEEEKSTLRQFGLSLEAPEEEHEP